MLSKLLVAFCLMALCVVVHAVGVTGVLRWLGRHPRQVGGFWSAAWLFVRLAASMIVLHLVEISVWGAFYAWQQALPDVRSALYFSAVTYTTTGYGDVVLPTEWQLIGGIEALTGILMCGWSTGFFFAVVSTLHKTDAAVRS